MLEPGITDGSAVATEPSAATSEGPPAAGDAPSPSSPAAATTSSPAAAAEQAHDRDGNDVKAPSDNNDTGDNDNDDDDNDDDDEDDETASEEGANTTVFVGSIPFEASEADIVDFFSPCGPIANVKLLLDAHSRRFKGSCFIRFDSADAAQQACALNGNTLMSRKLYISMSTSRPAPSSSPYVFIGNLDASLDVDSLYQFFAGCGTVVNIKLITDKYTGKHRGFGFVEFADDRSAKNSLALNGRMLGSRPIRIDFQRPKAPRSARSRGSGRGRADGHFGQGHHLPPHMHQHMAWPHAPPAMQYGHPFSPNYHMHGHPLSAQPHAGMPHPHAHGAATAFFPQATRPMHHHPHHHHPHYSPHSPGPFPGYFPGHFAFPPPFHMPPAPESPADHHAAPATPVSPSTERANPSSPPPTSPPTTRHQTAPMLLPYAPMTPEAALASGFGFQMDPYLAYGAGPYAPNSYGPSSPPSMNAAVAGQQPEHFE